VLDGRRNRAAGIAGAGFARTLSSALEMFTCVQGCNMRLVTHDEFMVRPFAERLRVFGQVTPENRAHLV
jgi:hypothetical protein